MNYTTLHQTNEKLVKRSKGRSRRNFFATHFFTKVPTQRFHRRKSLSSGFFLSPQINGSFRAQRARALDNALLGTKKNQGFLVGAEVFPSFFRDFSRSANKADREKSRKKRGKNEATHQKPWFFVFPRVLFVFEEHQKPPILFGFYVSRKKKPYVCFGFYDCGARLLPHLYVGGHQLVAAHQTDRGKARTFEQQKEIWNEVHSEGRRPSNERGRRPNEDAIVAGSSVCCNWW